MSELVVIGDCTLYYGNCLDIMNDIKNRSIDMILADPPYGTTQCKWDIVIPFKPMWEHYNRIIKDNGATVVCNCEPFGSMLRLSNLEDYKYDWVWDKIKGTGFLNAKIQPMRNHELVSVFYKNQCTYNPQKTYGHNKKVSFRSKNLQTDVYGEMSNDYYYDSTERYPRSIQDFSTDTQNSSRHPTQKPVKLMEYLVKTYTNTGELVLDNCMGSGTTGVSCINTGRKFIGIEKERKYFDIAVDRIKDAYKNYQPELFGQEAGV